MSVPEFNGYRMNLCYVILTGDADEICDRVFGLLSQFLGAFGLLIAGRLGRVST
jgi:hypothetical protein